MVRTMLRALVAVVGLGLLLLLPSSGSGAGGDAGWLSFGNTPDQNRYSPLTQIGPSNISDLGRAYTVDFQAVDPSVRRGEQSFPIVTDGKLFMTTNDDNVWALDPTTGKILWRWRPDNVAVFKNFGIVANRGVAVCDGRVFVLTLDMTIAELKESDGTLIARVPIGLAVPGASSNYGYSETSAPICADHRLIIGAAGSEYGVRGFVMAYHTDLTPAWANPFWTIPPEQTSWRKASRIVGGGVVWTPTTVDPTTNTLYIGTGSATPLYYPALRPGSNPRADSLIAIDLQTGRMRWWQQLISYNEWSYDVAQPPLVYTSKINGRSERVVSVATMEGLWYAYDAHTGRPIYQRVKVIDRTEHPALQPGKPVAVYPSSIGGLNYSPASFDPQTHDVYNAAAETAAVDEQVKLSPTQKKQKLLEGDIFLGLANGNFGSVLPGWHDHGSISAIDTATGRQVWKVTTPEPERGGVTTTASGLGFAGDGDGVLRAFDTKTGKVLWTFQTGHQIASGPSIFSIGGKEYLAITVGGTPTSSSGGTAALLQVFTLGGSHTQSPAPKLTAFRKPIRIAPPLTAFAQRPARPARSLAVAAASGVRINVQPALPVAPWNPNTSNAKIVSGRVLLQGSPVAGVQMSVDGYRLQQLTDRTGTFHYLIDNTIAHRAVAKVTGVRNASVGGHRLGATQAKRLLGASSGFSVGFAVTGLSTKTLKNGQVQVSGRLSDSSGVAPPPVSLYTYELSGTITNADGQPVKGAVVVTRTQDRDFWTFSSPSDSSGHYSSFFTASDESGADPVPLSVGVADGATSYGGNTGQVVNFERLHSATLAIELGSGTSYTPQKPSSVPGAVYEGVVVGVSGPGGVIKPVSERWPDAGGRFSFVLPSSARGKTVAFWENHRQAYSTLPATPGGAVDLRTWPAQLPADVPRGLATLRVP
jgi:PQQ-dependent dehydrogenase (methanol/ethanol family)